MKKRRVTVNLDEDLVEGLKEMNAPSVSAAVNAAVRDAVEREAHRRALLDWLDELNEKYGHPTEADYALADDLLDEAGFGGQRLSDGHRGAA